MLLEFSNDKIISKTKTLVQIDGVQFMGKTVFVFRKGVDYPIRIDFSSDGEALKAYNKIKKAFCDGENFLSID